MPELSSEGMNLDPDCEMFIRGDPEFRSITQLNKIGFPVGCVTIGWATVLFNNMQSNKPLLAGAHRYGIAAVIGVVIGMMGNKFRLAYQVERDFQYYHYMTLHPEDFQPKERVKYKNYLTNWVPWR